MFKQLFLPCSTANKEVIKAIRHNKKYAPMKILKHTAQSKSIQFQKHEKIFLVIPVTKRKRHIQVHLDKHFQLVRYLYGKRGFKHLPWVTHWNKIKPKVSLKEDVHSST